MTTYRIYELTGGETTITEGEVSNQTTTPVVLTQIGEAEGRSHGQAIRAYVNALVEGATLPQRVAAIADGSVHEMTVAVETKTQLRLT